MMIEHDDALRGRVARRIRAEYEKHSKSLPDEWEWITASKVIQIISQHIESKRRKDDETYMLLE